MNQKTALLKEAEKVLKDVLSDCVDFEEVRRLRCRIGRNLDSYQRMKWICDEEK